jgi:phage baseplate assembly protein W
MSVGFGPKVPLNVSKAENGLALTKTLAENTKQNLKNIILTSPGERVMIPDFGVGMRKFLFRNDSPEVYSELRSRIVSQIETYLPAVMIKDLNVFSEGQVLNIRLTYFIDGILSDDILNLSLDLNSIR